VVLVPADQRHVVRVEAVAARGVVAAGHEAQVLGGERLVRVVALRGPVVDRENPVRALAAGARVPALHAQQRRALAALEVVAGGVEDRAHRVDVRP
jgi:hypothetical protein